MPARYHKALTPRRRHAHAVVKGQLQHRAAADAVIEAREDRTVRFLASSLTQDRHGSVVDPKGIRTDNFAKNPVFLWAHQSGGMFTPCRPEDVIGQLTGWGVTSKGFEVDARFLDEKVNPAAERLYRLVQAGVLRAVSIGFMPLRWHEDPGGTLIYDEVDLLEVSLVIIGSNPEALALRSLLRKTMTNEQILKKLNLQEGAGRAALRAALLSYMATTSDGPEERKAVSEGCARMAEDHEEPDGDEGEGRAAEGEDEDKDDKEEDEDKEDREVTGTVLQVMREQLARAPKAAVDKEAEAVARVDQAIKRGLWPRENREQLLTLARKGKDARAVRQLGATEGQFTTSQRLRSGRVGTPVDPPPNSSTDKPEGARGKAAAMLAQVTQRAAGATRSIN